MRLSVIQQLLFVIFLSVVALAQSPIPSVAMNLEQQGRFAEAAQVWRRITQENPRDAAAFASFRDKKSSLKLLPPTRKHWLWIRSYLELNSTWAWPNSRKAVSCLQ